MSDIVISGSSKNEVKSYEIPSAGMYAARCIRIVDLGTVISDKYKNDKGDFVRKHEVEIVWELSELMEDGRPFVVSWRNNLSLNEKSNLYKFLTNWRGKPFTEDELRAFSLEKLLGQVCMVNVVHEAGYKDPSKTFAKVVAAGPLAKGMTIDAQVNESLIFSIKDLGTEIYDKLWPSQKKRIEKSVEYQQFNSQSAPFQKEADNLPF